MDEYTVESSVRVLVDSNERIRILHVDDDSSFLKIAKECLEMEPLLHVDTANSVAEALKKLEKEQYDVIVCDYQMPEKDGLQFLDELRASGNGIPFIMFTGKGREEIAIKALNLGADQYLNKTGDPATVYCELAHSIRQVVERKKAEQKIRQSEERYRDLFELAPDALLTLDMNGVITSCNAVTLTMSGYSREELIGQHFSKLGFLRMKDFIKYHALFASIEKGKLARSLQVTWHRKDGISVFSELTIGPLTEKGKSVGVQVIARDITERKTAKDLAIENQQKFAGLFAGNPEATVFVDQNMRIVDINPRFTSLFGYQLNEVRGKHLDDVVVPKNLVEEAKVLDEKAMDGYVYHDTVRARKDGSLVPVSVSAAPITVEGKITGYVEVYREITERKRYEESLSALNTHGRDLNMARSIEEVYELTLDAAEKTLGFEFADILMVEGKTLRVRSHRGYLGSLSLELPLDGDKGITVRAARTGKPVIVPDVSKDSAYVGVGLHMRSELAVPIKIGHRVLGILNTEREELNAFSEKDQELLEILASHAATAISNLNHANEVKAYTLEIEETKTKFESLFLGTPEAAVYLGPDFHIRDINPRFRELFGYSLAEVKGKHINDVIVPNDKMEEAQTLDAQSAEGYARQNTLRRRKDGSLVPVSVSAAPITVKGKIIGYVGVYIDVTERKRYEESLSALNTYGRDLNMARSIEEVYELTLDAAEKTLGFEFADILMVEGKTLRIIAQRGNVENLSLGLPLDGDKGITVKAARTGKPVLVPDVSKDDAYVSFRPQTRIRSELAVPIKIGPRLIGVLNVESVKSDAFDEKDQELLEILASHAATAMSNLDRAQKLDALNEKLRVVGGLTRHDVRNKLSTITGNTYLLKKRLAGANEDDKLEAIEKAVQQAVEIFDFARAYEMLGADKLVYTDVEKTVDEASLLLVDQNNIKVINECHGLTVLADSLLRQLFYNLIDNSLKHGQKTTRIRVYYEKTSQDSVKLVYEDDGVGIPAAEKSKLFREGYSTGGGTGYGLYLIKKMMEVYGWTIQETGTPRRGAQFTITIPKVNKHGKENYQVAC